MRPACRRFGVETARGRAERQPRWLRSLLLSPELIHLGPSFIVLTCGAALLLTSGLNAQTFTTLRSFTATDPNTYANSDGANPVAGLILSGNTLYGTAVYGGDSGRGTVFKLNTDGTGFTNLYSFTKISGPLSTNSDGANPIGGLLLSESTLYGTTQNGGDSGRGTVFKLNTDGTGFTTLYSFTPISGVLSTNSDGANPEAGLILSGNTLYGTARYGGSSGNGTVFSLTLPPPQLTIIHSEANIILTWPTNAIGFTLQSTTNLVSSALWTLVTPWPVVADGQNAVTNPISSTQQFYRLSQ